MLGTFYAQFVQYQLTRLTVQALSLLEWQPVYQTQRDNLDLVLDCWLVLLHLLTETQQGFQEKSSVFHIVR